MDIKYNEAINSQVITYRTGELGLPDKKGNWGSAGNVKALNLLYGSVLSPYSLTGKTHRHPNVIFFPASA